MYTYVFGEICKKGSCKITFVAWLCYVNWKWQLFYLALLEDKNSFMCICTFLAGDSSTPALSENTEAFATMLGEEIAATYHSEQQQVEKSPEVRPSSSEAPTSPVSSKDTIEVESEEKTSPRPVMESQSSISTNETVHMPPFPSPFYQFANSHFMANFMGMNLGVVKVDPNNSQGLDTVLVAKTVRELLSIHNIGQRLFAKHVLGLSQGTVSELLSKPKSWDKLTEKGRESYRKMYAWATDERNIVALKAISPKKGKKHTVY